MKRISLACLLTLFGTLSLRAEGTPPPARTALAPPAAVCGQGGLLTAGLPPKPTFRAVIPPPCYAITTCPDSSTLSCPNVSYTSNCVSSDGCWVQCDDVGFLFCPGQQSNPACAIY